MGTVTPATFEQNNKKEHFTVWQLLLRCPVHFLADFRF